MIVGVPKEIKTNENRVALVPAGAEALVADGHTVLVEQGAGLGSGFGDDAYKSVGAQIVAKVDEVWAKAEMIMKVKEPIAVEWPRMRKGQVIFTYFHFAAAEDLTKAVIGSDAIADALMRLTDQHEKGNEQRFDGDDEAEQAKGRFIKRFAPHPFLAI